MEQSGLIALVKHDWQEVFLVNFTDDLKSFTHIFFASDIWAFLQWR